MMDKNHNATGTDFESMEEILISESDLRNWNVSGNKKIRIYSWIMKSFRPDKCSLVRNELKSSTNACIIKN
jgi:hypothetical protein